MRFKAAIQNIPTFTKFTASLASLGNVAWVRLTNDDVRFTIIPEQGTQVWAVLAIDTIFETYTLQSAAESNTINLEVPLGPLLRALRTAAHAAAATIRLTKKDNVPSLCMTIVSTSVHAPASHHAFGPSDSATGTTSNSFAEDSAASVGAREGRGAREARDARDARDGGTDSEPGESAAPYPISNAALSLPRERETLITQSIPVRVLSAAHVASLHEPRCREPDVHIVLPPLAQLKAVSDRFAKLAAVSHLPLSSSTFTGERSAAFRQAMGGLGTGTGTVTGAGTHAGLDPGVGSGAAGGIGGMGSVMGGIGSSISGARQSTRNLPRASSGKSVTKLEMSATMSGRLRVKLKTDAARITSGWSGLANPELDPAQVEGGEEGLRAHPSERMRAAAVRWEERARERRGWAAAGVAGGSGSGSRAAGESGSRAAGESGSRAAGGSRVAGGPGVAAELDSDSEDDYDYDFDDEEEEEEEHENENETRGPGTGTGYRGRSPWATVRIDARDWGRVLSVGRLGGRVIACFCHEHALILYVYLPSQAEGVVGMAGAGAGPGGEESVLTYYVGSYSR